MRALLDDPHAFELEFHFEKAFFCERTIYDKFQSEKLINRDEVSALQTK